MTPGFMSVGEFRALFAGGAIRTWMDWSVLDDTTCVVTPRVCLGAGELGSCSTVWYRSGGEPADWRDQAAQRVTVAEEAARSPRRAADSTFIDAPHVFPALETGNGEVMLLDGNHRAVALAASGAAIHVLLVVLRGPRDPLICPDLIHELHGTSDEYEWRSLVAQIDRKFAGP